MRRRFLGILTMLFAGLTGCMAQAADSAPTRFSTQFVGAMDTVVQLIAYCTDEAEFTRAVQAVRGELERQEALLDIHRPGQRSIPGERGSGWHGCLSDRAVYAGSSLSGAVRASAGDEYRDGRSAAALGGCPCIGRAAG